TRSPTRRGTARATTSWARRAGDAAGDATPARARGRRADRGYERVMSIPPRRRGSSYRSSTRRKDEERDPGAHLRCPFCRAYEVSRLYVAPTQMDACECAACGARLDEET